MFLERNDKRAKSSLQTASEILSRRQCTEYSAKYITTLSRLACYTSAAQHVSCIPLRVDV